MISVSKVVYIDKLDVIVEAKLFSHFSLFVTFCQLLLTFSSLLVTFCLLLVTFYTLLVSFCFMIVIFCSMLENLTNKTLPQIFSLQISEISKFFWMVVFRVTNIASIDITLMSLLQYLDTLLSNLCTVELFFFELFPWSLGFALRNPYKLPQIFRTSIFRIPRFFKPYFFD